MRCNIWNLSHSCVDVKGDDDGDAVVDEDEDEDASWSFLLRRF